MQIIGKGNTAEVYEYEEGKVCKLFYNGYSQSAVLREYNNALCMEKMELPHPKAYGIINLKGRLGIVYNRLYGKSMLDKIFTGEDINWLLTQMCVLHKKIINRHTDEVSSYKEFLREVLKNDAAMLEVVNELPDGNCLCHGDFHPGNIWFNPDNTVSIIDFMNVCHGPWQYDVARTYFLICQGDPSDNIPDRDEILSQKRELANMYLNQMQVPYSEIQQYIFIIEECRKYEVN